MDKETLKYINIDRSNDLLKNLTLSSNKEEILYRAFETCPYNLQVYLRALNYGFLDYESYKTAEYFKQGKNIIFSLVSNLGDVEYPKKFKINYDSAEKMAEFTQSDVVTILQAKTKEYVSALIKAYQSAFELIANKEQCYKIIRGLSEKNLLAGEVISRGTAQAQVNSIVTDSIWNQLVNKCGYLDLLEKIKAFLPANVHLQSKSEIDDFLIEKITVNFEEIRQDIIKKINLKREEDEKNRIEEEKRKAAAVDLRKKRTKQVIRIGCIAVLIALILLLVSSLINSHMQKREEERIYQEKISTIENQVNNGEYEEAVNSLIYSDLSEEQKQEYYNSLVDRIHYKSFDVNGLVINIPEHWYIEDYSDPYIRSARDSDEDSLLTWYVKCMGSIDQVVRDGDDGWRRDNDYSSTTVVGCEEAYIRRELSKKVDVDEIYSVIDYYVVCQGFVYKIQYFAYDERFFEPEMQMLLNYVEFERFADAEIQANRKEETYVNATNLLEDGEDEEAFADILEAKTNKNILNQQRFLESSIDKATARTKEVAIMYEKLFEKHINGIVNEESFMQLSQKYETERDELKVKIRQYRDELSEIESLRTSKEQFTMAVRKFMQMETLTPALLNELIEKIEVHSIEGKGKNKTQKIIIHYRFVGVIENPVKEENIILEARQGVAVEYLTA